MKYLAYISIATFVIITALVSTRREWFWFIDDLPEGDKLAHFVGLGLLSFLMVLGFSSMNTHGHQFGPIRCLVAATLLATVDEVIQLAIPSRVFALDDLAWSLAGVVIFGFIAAGIVWIVQLRDKK